MTTRWRPPHPWLRDVPRPSAWEIVAWLCVGIAVAITIMSD